MPPRNWSAMTDEEKENAYRLLFSDSPPPELYGHDSYYSSSDNETVNLRERKRTEEAGFKRFDGNVALSEQDKGVESIKEGKQRRSEEFIFRERSSRLESSSRLDSFTRLAPQFESLSPRPLESVSVDNTTTRHAPQTLPQGQDKKHLSLHASNNKRFREHVQLAENPQSPENTMAPKKMTKETTQQWLDGVKYEADGSTNLKEEHELDAERLMHEKDAAVIDKMNDDFAPTLAAQAADTDDHAPSHDTKDNGISSATTENQPLKTGSGNFLASLIRRPLDVYAADAAARGKRAVPSEDEPKDLVKRQRED